MADAALIFGPMRSGTSMVAQVVHRLGFFIGPAVSVPIPPAWRSDFEEWELSKMLVGGERPSRNWFEDYIAEQMELSVRFGFGGRIAIKSPYLALVADEVVAALGRFKSRALDIRQGAVERSQPAWLSAASFAEIQSKSLALEPCEVKTILIRRGEEARLASFQAYPQLSKADDRKIAVMLRDLKPDHEITYEVATANPKGCAEELAAVLGVRDDAAVLEASRLILPCRQSQQQSQVAQPLDLAQ